MRNWRLMSVYSDINALVLYAMERELISPLDETYIKNQLIDILGLSEFKEAEAAEKELEEILTSLCDYAASKGIIEDTQTERDLFDTRIMGVLTPRPSEVVSKFCEMYLESPECATDWYYNFSQDTDYIRRYRIARDMKWTAETEYGTLDITINLAKPEKDPRAIAAAKNAPKAGYPACALCAESEGYAGRLDFPARQNHRIVPIEVNGELWKFQYSPYVYYNEHCIALNSAHVPMKIDDAVFPKLLSFIDVFPHYFIGSNADLPIVGGSILSHEHFQGGRYTFAMERAPVEKEYTVPGFEDVTVGRVKWPMSVIRLACADKERIFALAARILGAWREYTDEEAYIFAYTDNVPHNTITPIARRRGEMYELDLVLRNNITNDEHPLGVYHPHKELHHIKRENIGLIEVMGLAVLPSRLKKEIGLMCEYAKAGRDFSECEEIEKHAAWAREILPEKPADMSFLEYFKQEIGKVFAEVLACAGVFSRDEKGMAAFDKFIGNI
ncbi:MAG: UDP-glucose--hexose-1-phosphate uridylyltransferase [Oscillospiraceae bacterium]|nr:UDP-glucose--hexose-1-phosphate uridylyltransferase [Oscillospiraceae bacterium]